MLSMEDHLKLSTTIISSIDHDGEIADFVRKVRRYVSQGAISTSEALNCLQEYFDGPVRQYHGITNGSADSIPGWAEARRMIEASENAPIYDAS